MIYSCIKPYCLDRETRAYTEKCDGAGRSTLLGWLLNPKQMALHAVETLQLVRFDLDVSF